MPELYYQIYDTKIKVHFETEIGVDEHLRSKFGTSLRELRQPENKFDGMIYIINSDLDKPMFSVMNDTLICIGNFTKILELSGPVHSVVRYVLYEFIISMLIKKENLYCFHSSGFYDRENNTAVLIIGDRESGKTSLLLAGLEHNWQAIGDDRIAVKITNGKVVIYKSGTPVCSVKEHIMEEFEDLKGRIKEREIKSCQKAWFKEKCINIFDYYIKENEIVDPRIIVVFPRVEKDSVARLYELKDQSEIINKLYCNLTEKIRTCSLMNYKYAVPSLDNKVLMEKRENFVKYFYRKIEKVFWGFGEPKGLLSEIEKRIREE